MIVTVKNEVNEPEVRLRAHRNKGSRGPSRQHKRQDKNRFFQAGNLGIYQHASIRVAFRGAFQWGRISCSFSSTAGHRILSVFISTTDASICSPAWELEFISTIDHRTFIFEHASILSPSIHSPHGSANGYASMETYLLFAIYLPLRIGSLGQLWNALELALRTMNELLNWGLSSRFFSFVCIPS